MTGPPEAATPGRGASHGGRDTRRQRVYRFLTLIVQVVLMAGVVWFVVLREGRNALLTVLVIVLTILPWFARRLLRLDVPPAFQLVGAVFVFCAIFLGTTLGFYGRFLWWDTALHTVSGFMLGIVGFIVAFLVNGTDRRPDGMRISLLVALFGFMFAVTLGVFREIYEFVADSLIPGLDMQVVETGPTDTMVDLIAGTVGAAVVAVLGYVSSRAVRDSFIVDAVCAFIRRNPELFRRRPE